MTAGKDRKLFFKEIMKRKSRHSWWVQMDNHWYDEKLKKFVPDDQVDFGRGGYSSSFITPFQRLAHRLAMRSRNYKDTITLSKSSPLKNKKTSRWNEWTLV